MTPEALSITEIRNYMLLNNSRVTNHALVKHFKNFLTGENQKEARKLFKTYVNILATIKNENNQKYLILRKKYLNESPTEEEIERAMKIANESNVPSSPGDNSIGLDNSASGLLASPMSRQPPPYKPPPEVVKTPTLAKAAVQPLATGITVQQENVESYSEVVQEFSAALKVLGRGTKPETENEDNKPKEQLNEEPSSTELRGKSLSRANSIDDNETNNNKENIPRFSFSSGASGTSTMSADSAAEKSNNFDGENENPISVKEATRKFNRLASEEEAKVMSPPSKKKPENSLADTKDETPVNYNHPKAKEWIVAMAKASYQELAKLAQEYPELVRLPDPATGYTALHWAAKHGNQDVIKLIAGTYKADVNARSNGGYTPLHLSVQFGRVDTFELLWNVYKANRDIMDWSGNKPLDYRKQQTSVSASTYNKIKARRKNAVERDLSFLRIGSLNVRVKKTTEAFSNFLGVGNGNGHSTIPLAASHQHSRRNHHVHALKTISQPMPGNAAGRKNQNVLGSRASVPVNGNFDNRHKTWGSADNLPMPKEDEEDAAMMPPPKTSETVKKRHKSSKRGSVASSCATDSPRHSMSSSNSSSNLNSGYSSMPTTPNQLRSPLVNSVGDVDSDSDSACGFGSHWSVGERSSENL